MQHLRVVLAVLGCLALVAFVVVEGRRLRGFEDTLTLTIWGVGLLLASALLYVGRDRS